MISVTSTSRCIPALAILFCVPFLGAQVAVIDAGNRKQVIDGFGASTAWHGRITDREADAAFRNDRDDQLGLTILRIRIDPGGANADEIMNARKAKERGALILASPWTPPAWMKTNGGAVMGSLEPSYYGDYAAFLDDFCADAGVIDVVSLQNEPDARVDYESCVWTGAQLLDFCRDYASAISVPILMPESQNFSESLSDPVLNDSAACSAVSFIGGHLYGVSPRKYANALDRGKRVWMTENYFNGEDITTCMSLMAKQIVDCLADDMSAYIWWYLRQPDCNLIEPGGAFRKKAFIMAHFSKFIRPGARRIDAPVRPQNGVSLVAFTGENTVLVALNLNPSARNQTLTLVNDSTLQVRRYTTTDAKNLLDEGTIDLTDHSFTVTLEARSLTTFVGTRTSGVPDGRASDLPRRVRLEPNFPNPFNPVTTLEFSLPVRSRVVVRIFDTAGRTAAVPVDEELDAGEHRRRWDAAGLPGGVYLCRLQACGRVETRKLVLSR
jgi:glucuronoarabinoxylan endo-1,4-beta-xylanase